MTEPEPKPRSATLVWRTNKGYINPLDLGRIVELIHTYTCDSLPGSAIARMSFDGLELEITLRETS